VVTPQPLAEGEIALDLGEILTFQSTDWDVTLGLLGGRVLNLHHLGKATSAVVTQLGEAWRERVATCLLMGDLRLIETFEGSVAVTGEGSMAVTGQQTGPLGAGHLRLYQSNLSFMQADGAVLSLPLGRVHSVSFDEVRWEVILGGTGVEWRVGKLGLRTDMFRRLAEKCMADTRKRSEEALKALFPGFSAGQISSLVMKWPEGGILSHRELSLVSSEAPSSLLAHGVQEEQRPYLDKLLEVAGSAGSGSQGWYAGYKLLGRATEGDSDVPSDALVWFLCPLKSAKSGDLIAWEAASSEGHATYLFRGGASQLQAINEALVTVQFRREPVYLTTRELESDPQWTRHLIADRRLPNLTLLRRLFHSRLIHTDAANWAKALLSA